MKSHSIFAALLLVILSVSHTAGFKPSDPKSFIECEACQFLVTTIDVLLTQNKTETELETLVIKACIDFHLPNYPVYKPVCEGLVPEFAPEVIPIFTYMDFDPNSVCDLLGFCSANSVSKPSNLVFPPKPASIPKPITSGESTYILHVSDIHMDEQYSAGAYVDCGEPLCCRVENTGTIKAGYWGAYECDLNQAMLDSLLEDISKLDPQPEFLLWTGDNPPHDIWEESPQNQLNRIQYVSDRIQKFLPNITVVPAIGNHDTFPVDQYSRKPISEIYHDDFQWLSNGLAKFWSRWLPPSAVLTLISGGYYTMLLKPSLRVVALNTQWNDNYNFYLFLHDGQYKEQLDWLVQVLSEAETKGEKVILIGHIPSGHGASTTLSPWTSDLLAIVNRFNETISGSFFGHTHYDEYEVVTSPTNVPVSVNYIAPSATTYTYHNPSYRVYEFDSTNQVVDYKQYFTNLTQANIDNKPTWILEYTAKQEYGLPDLSPKSWYDLANRFESDSSLFQKWYWNFSARAVNGSCDASCVKSFVCSFKTSTPELYNACVGK